MVSVAHEAIGWYLLKESRRDDSLVDWSTRNLIVVLSFYLFKFKLEVGQIPGRLALREISFVLACSSLLRDIGQFSNRALVIPRRHCLHALFEKIVRIGTYENPLFAVAEVERAVKIDFLQRYFLNLLWTDVRLLERQIRLSSLGLLIIVHLYIDISSIDAKLLKAIESSKRPLYLGGGAVLPLDLHHEYFVSFVDLLLEPLCFLLNLPLFHHDIVLLSLFLIFVTKLLV